MNSGLRWMMVAAVSVLAIGISCIYGLWWITAIVGVAIGLLEQKKWRALSIVSIGSILGWGLPLAYLAARFPIMGTARVVSIFLGLAPGMGWLVILITLLLGFFLCLSGFWLGSSLRSFILWRIPSARS